MFWFLAGCVFIGERQTASTDQLGIYLASTCGGDPVEDAISCASAPRGPQYETAFTAPSTGTYILMTQDNDTVLQVFDQDEVELACNDDYTEEADLSNFGSRVVVDLRRGQTVDIVVTSYVECGDFRLDISAGEVADCADLYAPNGSSDELALLPQLGLLELTHSTDEDYFDALVPAFHRCYYNSDPTTLLRAETHDGAVMVFDTPNISAWSVEDETFGFRLVAERGSQPLCQEYLLESYCLACYDDPHEPNDTATSAVPLGLGEHELTIDQSAPDFFTVQLAPEQALVATITVGGEVTRLAVVDPLGNTVVDEDGFDGFAAFTGPGPGGTYLIEVQGLPCGFYTLDLQVQ